MPGITASRWSVEGLIQQWERQGHQKYDGLGLTLTKIPIRCFESGVLRTEGRQYIARAWYGVDRDKAVAECQNHLPQAGGFLLASVISALAAPLFLLVAATATVVASTTALICFGLAAYHWRQIPIEEFKKQGALDTQFYLQHGPVAAMRRKWRLGTLESIDRLELLQLDSVRRNNLQIALDSAKKNGWALRPAGALLSQSLVSTIAVILQPQQEIFDKIRINYERSITLIGISQCPSEEEQSGLIYMMYMTNALRGEIAFNRYCQIKPLPTCRLSNEQRNRLLRLVR